MNKKQEAEKAMMNVRKAFRMLATYQQRMLSIADYIRNRSGIKSAGFYGAKRFSDPIHRCQQEEDYDAKLKIFPTMWAWDFLYGYFFEYYLGKHSMQTKSGNKEVSMSIIQISDDGYMRSNNEVKKREILSTYESAESSRSWIMICVGYDDGWYFVPQIMTKETVSATQWSELACQTTEYLIKQESDLYVNEIGVDGTPCFFFVKRFPMEEFFDNRNIDELLKRFGEQLCAESGIRLFDF